VARAIIARFNIAIFSLFERPLKARPRGEARGVISRDCRRGAYIDSRARARARVDPSSPLARTRRIGAATAPRSNRINYRPLLITAGRPIKRGGP